MRHLLVAAEDGRLVEGLRGALPPSHVLVSARGIDETLDLLSRSSRVDAVVTDDPGVAAAIREEVPGSLPVVLVGRRARVADVARAVVGALGAS